MLKVRVMPTLLYREFQLVKGVGFDSWRIVGNAMQSILVYNMREVDELVFLDIDATSERRAPDYSLIDDLADECFMPLTVGGGITSSDDVQRLLAVGADKVSINTGAIENPELIREVAQRFGSQCVVLSLDCRRLPDGRYEVFSHAGSQATGIDPVLFAQDAARLGAGEILLTSIDRDGSMRGYDLELIRQVSEAVDIPVIASGGASDYEDMFQALSVGKAAAVAAASIFYFTEKTPLEAKEYLRKKGVPVRA